MHAKPLKGFTGADVLELVEDHDGDTYRAVYTVKLRGRVYVLASLPAAVLDPSELAPQRLAVL